MSEPVPAEATPAPAVAVPNPPGDAEAPSPAALAQPAAAVAEGPPTLEELQNQFCPKCQTGVLYVAVYDPEARHERGQAIRAGRSFSGGSYHVRCLHCDYYESRAMNPTVAVAPAATVEGA